MEDGNAEEEDEWEEYEEEDTEAEETEVTIKYTEYIEYIEYTEYIGRIQRNTCMVYGTLAGVDYITSPMSTPESTPTYLPWATLCQSRPQPYARVDINPMPESTLTLCQSRLDPPVYDFGFSL